MEKYINKNLMDENIIKIGLIVVSAIGLVVVTQIYKPQIIEKACDIINNIPLTSGLDVKYEHIDWFYNYFTVGSIATCAVFGISLVISSAADVTVNGVINNLDTIIAMNEVKPLGWKMQMSVDQWEHFLYESRSIIRHELFEIDNLKLVNKLNKIDYLTIIPSIKYYMNEIPVPIINDVYYQNLAIYKNNLMSYFASLSDHAFLNFHLKCVEKNKNFVLDYNINFNATQWNDLLNIYLYNFIKHGFNSEVLQFYNIKSLSMLNNLDSKYINLIKTYDKSYIEFGTLSSVSLLNFLIYGHELNQKYDVIFPLITNINCEHLTLRMIAWCDLLHQLNFVDFKITKIEGIDAIKTQMIDYSSLPTAFFDLISTPEGRDVFHYFKSVIYKTYYK